VFDNPSTWELNFVGGLIYIIFIPTRLVQMG
jgi:hypothetical protein